MGVAEGAVTAAWVERAEELRSSGVWDSARCLHGAAAEKRAEVRHTDGLGL